MMATAPRPARAIFPRAQLRHELAVREQRLLPVVRQALAGIRTLLTHQDLRIAAAMGQIPPIAPAIERRWAAYIDQMIAALTGPMPIARAAPAPDPEEQRRRERLFISAQELARRQIGALIRELSPAQLQAVRAQLAALMEFGPRPDVLAAIGQATGLTTPQTESVANFYRQRVDQGIAPGPAVAATQNYADRLLDLRARTIARHEAVTYTNQLVLERAAAATSAGGTIVKQWVSARDGRVDGGLPTGICRVLDDGSRIPVDQPFEYLGESFDAPPAHIGCRCLVEIWREE